MSTTTMPTAVKRACDACHRRKVKCDGVNPCRNCSSAQLACTYNAIPQKKGPKGSRAKVISELRETQRQSSLSARIHNRINGISNPTATTLAPTPGLLTNDMIKSCIDYFFANMYPSMPILNRQRLEQDAMAMDSTLDVYCLLSSLCAFMMLQPGMSVPSADPYGQESIPGASIITATLLLEETVRVRKGYDYLTNPTFYTMATSYFLFGIHYAIDLKTKAWCSLREATTMVHLLGMNKEEAYQSGDQSEIVRRRRLYWLLYAAERAYGLQEDRPLSLKATVNPPTPTDDPNDPYANQLVVFCRQVSVFRHFDGHFVDLWNKTRAGCSPGLVATLQKQQHDVTAALASADPQLNDVVRNQQWLQNLAWQINMAKGSGTSSTNDIAAYQYEMMPMAASFANQGSSELLNSGLIESLISITSDLTDALSIMPSSGSPFAVSPRDHLHQIAGILATLRVGEHRFAPLLLVKVHDVLPILVNPMLQAAPESSGCEVDIFDGFGTAGMVPQQPYMPIEEFKAEPTSSIGAAPSIQDVHSPFVSSPPILSPGMDFSHSMGGDFPPMADMVMPQSVGSSSTSSVSTGGQQQQHQLQLRQTQQPHQSPPLQQGQQQHQQHHQQQLGQQLPHQQHHGQMQHHNQQPQQTMAQQQPLPQHMPQQQHYQQQHMQQHSQQAHQAMNMLQGLGQNLGGTMSMQARSNAGVASPTSINGTAQPIEQSHNMVSALGNQAFAGSMHNLNKNVMSNNSNNNGNGNGNGNNLAMRPQSQRSSSFAMPGQQIRTVGDFQALQRANSDISTLSPMGMNSLGAELDFAALR